MTENDVYFLECETKNRDLGMTTFSTRLDHLIHDFAEWLMYNGITAADVDQPKIYRASDMACIAVLDLEGGQVMLQPRRTYTGPFAKLINKLRFRLRYIPRRLRYKVDVHRIHDAEGPEE